VSRGYEARRKAKRQQARAAAAPDPHERRTGPRRLVALVSVLIIAATFAVTAILGFGAGNGISKEQVEQKVTALLDGIPQRGAILGSPHAPITLQIFADLECPTVKRFVVTYLPSIVNTWVRDGSVRLDYRSLETDTLNEHTFFNQEVAALAAGRQNRMWNFILTFVHEQGLEYSGYATDSFLVDIATQVPGLKLAQWHLDREDALLSKHVALGVQSAHARDFRHTPSLLVGLTSGKVDRPASSSDVGTVKKQVEASLAQDVASLRKESTKDNPALRSANLAERKEIKEFFGN
jgi:Thioredoxin